MQKKYAVLKSSNVRTGIVFILFALLIFAGIQNLKPQAKLLPLLMVYCMVCFGIVLIVQELYRILKAAVIEVPVISQAQKAASRGVLKDYAITFLSMFVTYFLVEIIGFYTTIGLFVAFTYLFYIRTFTKKEIITSLIFSLILMLSLYFLFKGFMHLRTPPGVLI